MKIRNGFVSNSSSSSFLIYGVCVATDELIEKFRKKYIEDSVKNGYMDEDEEEIDLYEFTEWLEDGNNILPLPSRTGPYEDYLYIGPSPTSCPEYMTMGEWKAQIENKVEELFGSKKKCGWYTEAWRD